jgi:hypothetical protein
MIDIRVVTVKLGEKEFEVKEASFAISKPWKQRLMTEIKPLFEKLSGAPNMTFDKPADLFNLIPLAESIFIEGVSTIFDLLIGYSPVLGAEADYIANNASDRQIVAAFREVVTLADPFGVIGQLNRQIGRGIAGTSLNLQSANGVAA